LQGNSFCFTHAQFGVLYIKQARRSDAICDDENELMTQSNDVTYEFRPAG